MLNLFDELLRIITELDAAGIPYLLVGGLAYSLHVEVRATEDIDLLVLPEDWPRCAEILKSIGYINFSGELNFSNIRIRRLVKVVEADHLVLDFLLADGELKNAFSKSLTYQLQDNQIRLVDPRTLIELKRGRLSSKDKMDIEGLQKLLDGETP